MAELDERAQKRLQMAAQFVELHHADDNASLKSRFGTLQAQYLQELEGLSEAQFDWKPSEKEWSVREVCLHVAHSVAGEGKMLGALAAGHSITDKLRPNLMIDDPGAMAAVVESTRQGLQAGLDGYNLLDNSPNEEATAEHPYFGAYNCRQWAAFNILHLSIHLKQVQRVKSTEGFPA